MAVNNIEIIAAEDDYIVINKPAGLSVHPPHERHKEKTVIDFIKEKYPEIKDVGDDVKLRPGIVHRLDKQVSGALAIARRQEFFLFLKEQFQKGEVLKEYLSLVYGAVLRDEGEISLPLRKGEGRTLVVSQMNGDKVKKAVTLFEVIKRFQHYTYLKITLKTGRTHQIRAHLSHYGHSIVGDHKYLHPHYRSRKAFTKFVKSDRVFLHSYRLGFYDRLRNWVIYTAPIPSDLEGFLATLKDGRIT